MTTVDIPLPAARLYGLMAEFASPEAVLAAAAAVRAAGLTRAEAYTPFPIDGLAEALGAPRSRVPLLVLVGGITSACAAFGMMWFASVVHYPINAGGRPLNSWPAFVPITFEMGVLFAALSAVLGMFALCGLPQPYHSVFNAPEFGLASRERFFLCVEAADPAFDRATTRTLLESLVPLTVTEVAK